MGLCLFGVLLWSNYFSDVNLKKKNFAISLRWLLLHLQHNFGCIFPQLQHSLETSEPRMPSEKRVGGGKRRWIGRWKAVVSPLIPRLADLRQLGATESSPRPHQRSPDSIAELLFPVDPASGAPPPPPWLTASTTISPVTSSYKWTVDWLINCGDVEVEDQELPGGGGLPH